MKEEGTGQWEREISGERLGGGGLEEAAAGM